MVDPPFCPVPWPEPWAPRIATVDTTAAAKLTAAYEPCLTSHVGWVIEAKSRKKDAAALKKEEHGQLLVAKAWFAKHYNGYEVVCVSVHPQAKATKAAIADASHALTYQRLASLVSDARALLTALCDSQLPADDLVRECATLLSKSAIQAERLADKYLQPFSDR